VAVELTRKGWRRALTGAPRSVRIPPHVLVGLAAAVLAVAYTSTLLATYNARRDERDARRQLADAQQLLALPPGASDNLAAQLTWARAEYAAWQREPLTPSVDPASDAATALLVRHADAAGLTVRGITRVAPASARLGTVAYDVQALTVSVSGSPAQVAAYLTDMRKVEPAMFPSLVSMSVNETGLAQAELSFRSYAEAATPTAVAAASRTPGVRR
jgi:hypothetical protein